MKKRADILLVEQNRCRSRAHAKDLIKQGHVSVNGAQVSKAGEEFDEEIQFEIKSEKQYVGRGAHKLAAAIEFLQLDVAGKIVADIGASTGGFTEVLLERGATFSYAIDVGHGQLAAKLQTNDSVYNLEGVNIKYQFCLFDEIDLAVVDLSFISLRLVLENIINLLGPSGCCIALFKPQFECGLKALNNQGVVKDLDFIKNELGKFIEFCESKQIFIRSVFPCEIKGKQGNQEFFIYIDKTMEHSLIDKKELNL